MRYLFPAIFFFLFQFKCVAQVWPAEGSRLNYVLVGFKAGDKRGPTRFKIARGKHDKEASFLKNIIVNTSSDSNEIIVTLPAFGQDYTWQYVNSNNGRTESSGLIHFSTLSSPYTDTSRYRLRVLQPYADTDLLFFLDYSRVMYNGRGEAQWFLPDMPGRIDSGTLVRDIRLTPFGTITFLTDTTAYEIDYNANILWTGPKTTDSTLRKKTGNYHHELRRLSNGNYMLMGSEKVKKILPADLPGEATRSLNVEEVNGSLQAEIEYGTLVEYSPTGRLIWSWSSAGYFTGNEIIHAEGRGGYSAGTHMNAFYFDEKKNVVYVSFRDRNRVIKLNYPGGTILAEYGDGKKGSGHFSGQHSCMLSSAGELYLFNNGVGAHRGEPISSIQVFNEPTRADEPLELKWEFKCDIDKETAAAGSRGGNVAEIAPGLFSCCMGLTPRVFIVNENKIVLFNALSQKRVGENWQEMQQYHHFPFNKSQIRPLIFR